MNKYDALFEDEDDIFAGTPESRYWDIFKQVADDLARQEFDKVLTRYAAMEMMLSDTIHEDEINDKVDQFAFANSIDIEARKKSLYMEFAGDLIYKVSD